MLAKIADYFLDEKKKKHYYIKIINKNKKPITFSWIIYDFNFDTFKVDWVYELLKMEILCSSPLNLFKKLIKSQFQDPMNNFWCLKKDDTQFIGVSFKIFLDLIKKKDNFTFYYPLINQSYVIIFKGTSNKPDTFKLIIYLNNKNFSYIDLINYFQKKIGIQLKKIKKVTLSQRPFYNMGEDFPKLISTLGFIGPKYYCEFYYFIKKPKIKTNTLIDNLSHLIVWNNEKPIKYKEKKRFFFSQANFLDLEEVSIFSLRTGKCINNDEFF